ncbi:TOMM precursor leader peptide-binding protein [Amycolatopsis sp. cg5]|uniref:TOMM precursor leader peptide-binding protein n=1 Tax=Amycolatopsis sp. cg5 TaxID=3238802 RepID=UPI003525AE99
MNPVFHTTPGGTGLWVYGDGAFGELVLDGLGGAVLGRARLLVCVTQGARPAFAETVASRAEIAKLPWLPLELDGTMLRCGPVTGTGAGPCPECTGRRRRQHSRQARLAGLVADGTEPAFLPQHRELAIAVLGSVVRAFTDHGTADEIHEVDLVRGDFAKHRVIPVHGCPVCDPRGAAEQSWVRLAAGLGIRAGVRR